MTNKNAGREGEAPAEPFSAANMLAIALERRLAAEKAPQERRPPEIRKRAIEKMFRAAASAAPIEHNRPNDEQLRAAVLNCLMLV